MWVIEFHFQLYTGSLTARPSISIITKENNELLPLLDALIIIVLPFDTELKYACDFHYIGYTCAF